ncbi:MAG: hypothetical protein QOG83_1011 [Alphaproteobacteria bacterium]|nr:hypothetical protein [Alphaproteobacteria bacterium]
MAMLDRRLLGSVALAAALIATTAGAQAPDESKFPEWRGQWTRLISGGQWDESKPAGRGQQAPLTPEYQAEFEAAQADLRAGGKGNTPSMTCIPPGLPRALIVYEAMEIVVKPYATYMLFEFMDPIRRIYTDGRDWPKTIEPTFLGYSIGHWEDEDGDGRYDTLVVETRGFKGPRIVDGSGIPMHKDNQTVIKERIFLDKTKPDLLHDEVTIIDHALTRPWTVMRGYRREPNPTWYEYNCSEDNQHVFLGKDPYLLSAEGFLMPTRKDQPPPDLRYFSQPRN